METAGRGHRQPYAYSIDRLFFIRMMAARLKRFRIISKGRIVKGVKAFFPVAEQAPS
jgi:hypothetical protein